MSTPAVRAAIGSDLSEIYSVWYATETDGVDNPPPPGANLWFPHLLRTGTLVVAADGTGRLVGFAAVRQAGPITVLTDCFVHPSAQSGGVGSALLDAVVPRSGAVATFASSDRRAVPSYARRRMLPRWPVYYVSAPRARLGHIDNKFTVAPAGADGLRFLVDANTDQEYLATIGAVNLEVRADGRVIGGATVSAPSPFRLVNAAGATVIESSALVGRGIDTLLAVVAWCLEAGVPSVDVQLAGTHEAFVRLLELGFKISDVDMACASDERLLADPTRTTFCGEPLRTVDRRP